MGPIYVFDWFEATDTVGDKMCARIFVLDLAPSILQSEFPMIFCRCISWVVPECSAKFGLKIPRNGSHFNSKKITYLHFSPNLYFSYSNEKFIIGRDIFRGKVHLVRIFDLKRP